MVEVRAISVNRGELHRLHDPANIGWRPGWDFVGEVVGGTGFPLGSRVFGMSDGGSWAQRVAVPVTRVAAVPSALSWARAAALPVAGLTALRTLRLAGPLAGRHVLITGAGGGVGRFAVQLAHRAGARVTALAGSARRVAGLRALGADQVVTDLAGLAGGYDLILESAGGDVLGRALALLAPGGLVVSYGNSARASSTFLVNDFYPRQARLCGFYLPDDAITTPLRADLATLAEWCAAGELTVPIAEETGWRDVAAVLDRLRDRLIDGKAVLRLDSDPISS
ncbi:MAG TPA: zinc-binding dehydrogenase [Pseudonocardiaceae bacterium]|nr:zinc-binding dehydrogenase [Pseudonocardiaceae bacterium]